MVGGRGNRGFFWLIEVVYLLGQNLHFLRVTIKDRFHLVCTQIIHYQYILDDGSSGVDGEMVVVGEESLYMASASK